VVNTLLLLAVPIEFRDDEHRPGAFWQLPCPRANGNEFLVIRQYSRFLGWHPPWPNPKKWEYPEIPTGPDQCPTVPQPVLFTPFLMFASVAFIQIYGY